MIFIKLFFGVLILVFLNGCFQNTALLGPGVTAATTGNMLQAGLQFGASSIIKKETGKDPFTLIKSQFIEDREDKNAKILQ